MTELNAEKLTLKDWGEVLGEVCKRPQMFTGSADLYAVLDFIGGYLYAHGLQGTQKPEPEWRLFNYWLAKKFGYARNVGWYHARDYFPTNEEALAMFPRLLAEFRNERRDTTAGAT